MKKLILGIIAAIFVIVGTGCSSEAINEEVKKDVTIPKGNTNVEIQEKVSGIYEAKENTFESPSQDDISSPEDVMASIDASVMGNYVETLAYNPNSNTIFLNLNPHAVETENLLLGITSNDPYVHEKAQETLNILEEFIENVADLGSCDVVLADPDGKVIMSVENGIFSMGKYYANY
jgi:hypothetical protein